ncbi:MULTISPECIES: isopenicillin N synthase family dioxygenase [Pseudonocardia]|uniref:2-oxoglutarate-dependent ethylene/succinate-forming enzyme n=2 Tax=Pseudonocardia TaxID=1847 RepID=A0A1Y2MNB7_PSEAH|nr:MULTISPECIES: 2-oxoglutarate and iron-dependent oxygenase domain-containing protein [Pseudonocardia]OSY36740.1 2-oxoglutarate-dependent ethylene/succinate-forming enzyme [Pseudonocardia autotrophica]TDN77145.1 isopenicillin N synthase-like dioxygenase [Pseudonocardia autotrophica]BBG01150.1 2-oxobutyrate oxidase [Pseudonocardia autotrophica]GEC26794.1 2-oxobutyrate oxidase [Pseudonocardia saturnea]
MTGLTTANDPVPTLRLDRARRPDGSFDPAFTDALRDALHRIGFLRLHGFGVAPGQVAELMAAAGAFFDLPPEQRLALDNRESPHFRGYTRLGHEITAGRPDAREQIDFGPELPARPRAEWDEPYQLLEGPNRWPDDTVPQLRERAHDWADLMSRVATELTRALAAGLGLPEDHFDPLFTGEPHWFGKVIRYVGPPAGETLTPDAQGVGPHADWGFLTLLLQDPEGPAAGLQARPPGSDWVDVPPHGDSLVINVGEMLEVATDGYLVATPHRVLACGPGTTRQSVGFFWSPRLDARLDPVPLPADLAAQAPGVHETAQNALLPRFGDNALKGWLRSHPEVAIRHHPELVRTARGSVDAESVQ